MIRPNGAETLTSAQHPEIANIVASPIAPEATPSRRLRVAVGKASVVFATTSLATAGLASATHNERLYDPSTDSAPHQAASTYTLDNTSRVAHEAQDIYRGRVTINLSADTKAAPTPSPSDSPGIAVAKIMGISETDVRQGKHSVVTIAGKQVDLRNHITDTRVAKPWGKSKDSAWTWSEEMIRVKSKAAGLDDTRIKQVATDPKAVTRVMGGYFKDNPEVKQDPRHFLDAGTSYQTKGAQVEADALVSAMRTASVPGPTTATQPATPNQSAPKHAKPDNPDLTQPQANAAKPQPTKRANNSAYTSQQPNRGTSKGEEVFLATTKLGGISFLGIAAAIGAGLGFNWARRRWRNRRQEQPVYAQQPPEPEGPPEGPNGGGEDDPMAELRRVTKEDHDTGNDGYFGPRPEPVGAHRGPVQLDWGPRTATSATPAHSAEAPTAKILTLPLPTAEEIANRNDIPTNPKARIVVVPFQRKKELRGQGWVDEKTGEYHGIHRRLIPEEPASDAAVGKNTSEYHGRHRKPVPEEERILAAV